MNFKTKKPSLLILGGSSLLSYLWCEAVKKDFRIYVSQHIRDVSYLKYPTIFLNVDSLESLKETLKKYSIDYVVNTIGLTSVE